MFKLKITNFFFLVEIFLFLFFLLFLFKLLFSYLQIVLINKLRYLKTNTRYTSLLLVLPYHEVMFEDITSYMNVILNSWNKGFIRDLVETLDYNPYAFYAITIYFIFFFVPLHIKLKYYGKIPRIFHSIKNLIVVTVATLFLIRFLLPYLIYYMIYSYLCTIFTIIFCLIQILRIRFNKDYEFKIGSIIYQINEVFRPLRQYIIEESSEVVECFLIFWIDIITILLISPINLGAGLIFVHFKKYKKGNFLRSLFYSLLFRYIFGIPLFFFKGLLKSYRKCFYHRQDILYHLIGDKCTTMYFWVLDFYNKCLFYDKKKKKISYKCLGTILWKMLSKR